MTPSCFSWFTRVDLDWFGLLWLFLPLISSRTRFPTWLVFGWITFLPRVFNSLPDLLASDEKDSIPMLTKWMFVHCSALLPNSCPCNAVHPMQCLVERRRESILCNIGFVLQTASLVKSVLNKCWMMIASYYSGQRFHFKDILDTLLLGLIVAGSQRRWRSVISCMCFVHCFPCNSDGHQLPRLAFALAIINDHCNGDHS